MLRQTKRLYLDVADLRFSVAQFRVALLTIFMGCLFATPLTHADVLAVNTGKYRSGGTVIDVPCELIGTGRLRYPPKARKFRYVGQVIVGFSVAKDGSVSGARIADADPPGIFERSALSHIRTWKYKPPTVNGKVVQVDDIYVRLTFQPDR